MAEDASKVTQPATGAAPPAPPAAKTPEFTGTLPYEVYRAQSAMRDIEEGRALKMDVSVPGGRFVNADGTVVDANGVPIKD